MRTIKDIMGRCVITEDGHWLWKGALRPDGRPNISAPDYTRANGDMRTQCGMRAVWHCVHQKPVPEGFRVYGTCDERACCLPGHIACTSEEDFGLWIQRKGIYKNQTSRILANRAIGRARAKLTADLIAEIQASLETGEVLATRLGLSTSTVSKARRGEALAFHGVGMFSGLIAANQAGRARA